MAKQNPEDTVSLCGGEEPPELPLGVRLVRTLRGHADWIGRIAWSPDGRMLASAGADKTIRLWDAETGECVRTLEGHADVVMSVAFDPIGRMLASASDDQTVKLWDVKSGKTLKTLDGHNHWVLSVAFDPRGRMLASAGTDQTVKLWDTTNGRLLHALAGHYDWVRIVAFDPEGGILASGSSDSTIKLWDAASGQLLRTLEGHTHNVRSLAIDPAGRTLASASRDRTVKLWEMTSGKLLRTLEGHTGAVDAVAFSTDGHLVASKSHDGTIRLWISETGKTAAVIPEPTSTRLWLPGLAFCPKAPLLASTGSPASTPDDKGGWLMHLWALDLSVLLGQPAAPSFTYTSAKVVLVGNAGVGKTGLGWRLAHGAFKEHASTHGQQFWPLTDLDHTRRDGAQCEAVLWDLAGQPDYRLIHALFLDDADLALVLFDPTHPDDPLQGVDFWLNQLGGQRAIAAMGDRHSTDGAMPATADACLKILVAARSDRGDARLTREELEAFCQQRGIRAYHVTSAFKGEGVEELIARMKALIPWEKKPTTVTTETFKRIKDYVLALKGDRRQQEVILTRAELRQRLEAMDAAWQFTDAEMLTAVGHLANHGYVTRLKTSRGEPRLLLAPELLNNLAASFVLEARRNDQGLGALEEKRLLMGEYAFPELAHLPAAERDILLDAVTVLFLEHNVCFRETNPLTSVAYLVFPELINLKKPAIENEQPIEDGVAYSVSGAVENVYASLVVLLGYTHTFTRLNQWRNHARYEVGHGLVCGFRQEAERDGQLEFVLYFGKGVSGPMRMVFQGLFENFLARRNLAVTRYEPVSCSNDHVLNRAVVREQMAGGVDFAFCNRCGDRIALPKANETIQLTQQQAADMEAQRHTADQRSCFEGVVLRLKKYVMDQKTPSPECFISYAWGTPEHEHWVQRSLAKDLVNAGLVVVLDRWENARIGASVPRFVERIGKCDRVIVVGTPLYRLKYENNEPMGGFVVAAEGDLISKRMIGTEAQKLSVFPVLLAGSAESSFPFLLQTRVYADFRQSEAYFATALDLMLSLYEIHPQHPFATELRESLESSSFHPI